MREFFITLLTASVLGGILAILASGSPYEKYIKYLAGLVCVVLILSPLKSLVSAPFSLPKVEETASVKQINTSEANAAVEAVTILKLEEYIDLLLFEKFGIKTDFTDIKIEWADDCMVIKELTVYLYPTDQSMIGDAQKYLAEKIDSSVTVRVSPQLTAE